MNFSLVVGLLLLGFLVAQDVKTIVGASKTFSCSDSKSNLDSKNITSISINTDTYYIGYR
jgi:hypothetical protein